MSLIPITALFIIITLHTRSVDCTPPKKSITISANSKLGSGNISSLERGAVALAMSQAFKVRSGEKSVAEAADAVKKLGEKYPNVVIDKEAIANIAAEIDHPVAAVEEITKDILRQAGLMDSGAGSSTTPTTKK